MQLRKDIKDDRIHCVIYFVSSSSHRGLKEMDLTFIKTLAEQTNVIPVIGKADGLTAEELQSIKSKVLLFLT